MLECILVELTHLLEIHCLNVETVLNGRLSINRVQKNFVTDFFNSGEVFGVSF